MRRVSKFEADARSRLARWRQARRRRKLDPTLKARDEAWKKRAAQIDRAEPAIEAAGFNEAEHYYPGGVPSYCRCGSVADHNRRYDEILEAA